MSKRYEEYLHDPSIKVPKSTSSKNKIIRTSQSDSEEDNVWRSIDTNIISAPSSTSGGSASTTSNSVQQQFSRKSNSPSGNSGIISNLQRTSTSSKMSTFALRSSDSSVHNGSNLNNFDINEEWVQELAEDLYDISANDDSDSSNDDDDNFRQAEVNDNNVPLNRLQELLEEESTNNIIDSNLVVNKAEMLLAVLKYGLVHNLCQTAIADLCKMINSFFANSILPDTRYLINKLFNRTETVEYHAVCKFCKAYISKFDRTDKSIECRQCNKSIQLKDPTYTNFFTIMDIENEVINTIEINSEHYMSVVNERRQNNISFCDFTDGVLYKKLMSSVSENDKDNFITGTFNSDGSPVFESSKFCIWPIQLIINEMPYRVRTSNPIVCGMWFGKDKPDMNDFLKPFINQMNKLANVGVTCKIENEVRQIKLYTVTCCVDSVARAPMQGLVQFNGYFGCNWCLHPGLYVATQKGGSVKYVVLDEIPSKRTEEETLVQMQQSVISQNPVKGVKRPSQLLNLEKFNIVSGFIPDTMHCINLGIAEQFLNYWIAHLNDELATIDNLVSKIKAPNQIERLSRSIKDRKYWKAREWENWTLYYSIPILLSFPNMQRFVKHWALLVEAYFILLKNCITRDEISRAHESLIKFVAVTETLYGKHAMTFNVHQLTHLAQSVIDWGPLWAHSGYCFESGNGDIVKRIQSAKGVVHQICRILSMKQSELILQRHVNLLENSNIQSFISYLNGKQIIKSFKYTEIRYFGTSRPLSQCLINKLQLSEDSIVYNKIVKDNCLYTTNQKKRIRSNNSYAVTKEGSFIEIMKFIVDPLNNRELSLCKVLHTTSILDNDTLFIKKIVRSFQEVIIDTKSIDKVCVYIENDSSKYICAVPNLHYY